MDRRILAIVIGMVVIVSGVVVVLFMTPPPKQTTYHYGRNLTSSDPRATLVRLFEVVDCEIEISFVNNLDLLYSVDIEFFESVRPWDDFTWLDAQTPPVEVKNFIGINVGELRDGHILVPELNDVRVKSINLTLGIACNHTIQIKGKNMTTSVLYDNGVRLTGSELQYEDQDNEGGDVFIFMDSDANITDCDFKINVWGTDTVSLDIRNPSILGGTVDVLNAELGTVQLLGWTQGGYSGNWRFSRTATEEMTVDLSAETAHVSLLTQNP